MSPEEEFKNSIKQIISRGKEMKFYATFVGAIFQANFGMHSNMGVFCTIQRHPLYNPCMNSSFDLYLRIYLAFP